MALDVGIKSADGVDGPLERELVARLPFPYFSFLMEYFAYFTDQTGIHIDAYDDALVSGEDLQTLDKQLQLALGDIGDRPEQWTERVGFQTAPRREIYERVERDPFLAEVETLRLLIRRAQKSGRPLMFLGD